MIKRKISNFYEKLIFGENSWGNNSWLNFKLAVSRRIIKIPGRTTPQAAETQTSAKG